MLLALAVLRSKQYSILTGGAQQNIDVSDLETINTGKGVPYSVQGEVDFFNMTDTLVTSSQYYGSSVRFSSSSHRLTMDRKLTSIMRDCDDKRFILAQLCEEAFSYSLASIKYVRFRFGIIAGLVQI